MKKKLVLVLATLMCISLCACGGSESTSGNNTSETKTEENGFTPSQVTEKEEVEETTTAPANMTIEEMQQYYDVEKYLGTPYLVECECSGGEVKGTVNLIGKTEIYYAEYVTEDYDGYEDAMVIFVVEKTDSLEYWKKYNVIACDNGTPTDVNDDVIVYIFTTPIE